MRHRTHNVDANQGEIVAALRKVGALVADTSMVGNGFPDIVVRHRGRIFLIEIKNPAVRACDRKLTPAEEVFHKLWVGHVHIVESVEQALAVLGIVV